MRPLGGQPKVLKYPHTGEAPLNFYCVITGPMLDFASGSRLQNFNPFPKNSLFVQLSMIF